MGFFPIGYIRNLGNIFDNRIEKICLKVCFLILHNGSKAFQTAARINILVCKKIVLTVLCAVILRKDQIPYFEETVTVASNAAGGLAASTFFSEININLRVRTTGAGANLPEVIFQRHDMIRQHISLFQPYGTCLIILRVDGNPELVFGKFDNFCQKFPRPWNRFFLEVVAEGEVSKHLEEGLMTCGTPDILDIAGPYTALTGYDTIVGGLHLSRKERLQWCHASADQEQCRIIFRNEGVAG